MRDYNVIDSRDLTRRLDDLRGRTKTVYFLVARSEQSGPFTSEDDADKIGRRSGEAYKVEEKEVLDLDAFDAEETEELAALDGLFGPKGDLSYWAEDRREGVRLVTKDGFEAYVEEYARDTGAVLQDAKWPYNHIDWKAAADEMISWGWTEITFRGVDYYWRE